MTIHFVKTGDDFEIPGVTYGTSKPEFWQSRPLDLNQIPSQDALEGYIEVNGQHPIIVVKIPSGQHWGDSIRGYVGHRTTFMVFEIIQVMKPNYFKCQELIEFPIRREKE
jgi:hypothetical protein